MPFALLVRRTLQSSYSQEVPEVSSQGRSSGLNHVCWFATVLMFCLSLPSSTHAQANVTGTWQTLQNLMPINPVHAALLRNGKVLIVSGSGNTSLSIPFEAGVFDPATNTVTRQPVGWDMFCNGMVVLPDGRVFVNGGTLQYDPFFGERRSAVYDPVTGQFT